MGWIKKNRGSGWRDLSADVPDLVSGRLLVRRLGDRVQIVFDELLLNASGNRSFPRLPYGLRPMFRLQENWFILNSSVPPTGTINLSATGYFNVYGVDPTRAMVMQLEYETSDPAPSTYPGSVVA